MKRTVIVIEGPHMRPTKMHLVLGKTEREWKENFGDIPGMWDILLEEFLDGAMEVNDTIWYWYIDGRCYETDEYVEEKEEYAYYQPFIYVDGPGSHSYISFPDKFYSFQAFASRKEANAWMRNHGYEMGTFTVKKYTGGDIEGVTIINSKGEIIKASE